MNQEFYNAVKESVQMSQQRWVEWRHEMTGLLHCGSCLSLHKCWFVFEKAPVFHYTKNAIAQLLQFRHHKLKAMLLQKVTIASIIHTCLIPRTSTSMERIKLLKVGDTPFQIQSGCKMKSKSKENRSIFWEITNWVY